MSQPSQDTAPLAHQADPMSGPRPRLLVFDVNETLSDMCSMADRFADIGAPPFLAAAWFAAVLRDGFALTVNGANPDFADLARAGLAAALATQPVEHLDDAVDQLMTAFASLPAHSDVVEGIADLAATGVRLVTFSNGSAAIAEGLLQRNGIDHHFERLLSVQDAPAWKPAESAYQYALNVCDVDATDALLVAVHPWDLHGAKAAGLTTAYLNRKGATYPNYFSRPDIEVGSLAQLAELLTAAERSPD
ncbi:haloacid dehalogenase type II [Knoellia sp. S7-12]|uniref:haloacid dehalogenase type II n=1 Tax=Knoellia sp. S7-12 TaxID=3126698 RepID=UPI003367A43F